MSKARTNGTKNGSSSGLEDKVGHAGPNSQLDIYDGVVNPDSEDDIVGKIGSSYYTEDEQWQQIRSYLKGMYGAAAFGRRLYERALDETKFSLGERGCDIVTHDGDTRTELDGWKQWSEASQKRRSVNKKRSPRAVIRERGEDIWDVLNEEQQIIALADIAGVTGEWIPPQWRMMEARNEAAKSRDARLLDNLFGTRNKQQIHEESHQSAQRINGGSSRLGGGER